MWYLLLFYIVYKNSVMFDCSEGTQRLCIEHKQRVSRLDMICLTQIAPHTVFGLPGNVFIMALRCDCSLGLCITASDANVSKLALVGPTGLMQFFQSTKYFVTIKLALTISELSPPLCQSFRGVDYTIHAISISQRCCYICERDGLLGKFDIARAQELGIPKGPLYAILKNGKAVTLPDGRTIQPEEVVAPTTPPQFALIICKIDSSAACLDELVSHSAWNRFYAAGDGYGQLEIIVHMSPVSVVTSDAYAAWLNRFHANVKHIFVGQGCGGLSAYVAATRYSSKLHSLFPQLFSRIALDGSPAALMNLKGIYGSPGLTYHMQPMRVRGVMDVMLKENRVAALHADLDDFHTNMAPQVPELVTAAHTLRERLLACNDSCKAMDILRDKNALPMGCEGHVKCLLQHPYNAIVFLGTGCAVPSKYRNVSGIFIQV